MKNLSLPAQMLQQLRTHIERLRDRESYNRHDMVGPAALWRQKRRFQIDLLRRQGLKPQHKLVDIGCGTLRGGLPLINYLDRGNYVGLDVRREVLAEAHHEIDRAGLGGKAPTLLHCEDFPALDCDGYFDVAWAFAVLIHMTDESCQECLNWVANRLASGGAFYADVNLGAARQGLGHGMGTPFPVITRPFAVYELMAKNARLAVQDLGSLAAHGHRTGLTGDERHILRLSADGVRSGHIASFTDGTVQGGPAPNDCV